MEQVFYDKNKKIIKKGDVLDLPEDYFFDGLVRLDPTNQRLYILGNDCLPLYLDRFSSSFTKQFTVK